MRVAIVVATVVLALAALAGCITLVGCITVIDAASLGLLRDGKEFTETQTQVIPIPEGTVIEADTTNGSIRVKPWDKPEVELVVEKRVQGVSEEESKEYLDRIVVKVEQKEGRLDIEVEHPDGERGLNYAGSLALRVPKATSVDLDTTNGGIKVEGITGAVKADTTNGSVDCTGALAEVEVETTNGGVRVTCEQGAEPLKGISCSSTNGGVTITLPRDTSFELEAKTVNGSVKNDFGVPVEGRFVRNHAKGTVGSGGPRVSATTTNGSVSVKAL